MILTIIAFILGIVTYQIIKALYYKQCNTYNYSITYKYDDTKITFNGDVKALNKEDAEEIIKRGMQKLHKEYIIQILNIEIWEQ